MSSSPELLLLYPLYLKLFTSWVLLVWFRRGNSRLILDLALFPVFSPVFGNVFTSGPSLQTLDKKISDLAEMCTDAREMKTFQSMQPLQIRVNTTAAVSKRFFI